MERNKRDFYSAAGYDAVARKKIKELEDKVGGGAGGSDIFVVPVEYDWDSVDEQGNPALMCDVSFDEIAAAVNAEKYVFVKLNNVRHPFAWFGAEDEEVIIFRLASFEPIYHYDNGEFECLELQLADIVFYRSGRVKERVSSFEVSATPR